MNTDQSSPLGPVGKVPAPIAGHASLLHAIFIRSPEAMALSRVRDGVLVDVNQQWELLTGYSRAEAV